MDHLRKLVQKYRLELSNREGNFNRMFTEKTPVHLDQRSLKSLAPLPPKAPSKDRSLNHSMDLFPDSDKVSYQNIVSVFYMLPAEFLSTKRCMYG